MTSIRYYELPNNGNLICAVIQLLSIVNFIKFNVMALPKQQEEEILLLHALSRRPFNQNNLNDLDISTNTVFNMLKQCKL